ncbi:MAG TPA: DNA polymerase/3'-5' exonuclease PolX [Ktedonobacterales bacterium]|nr:DNA polymerase/3'-5' exonuclease PolX [Ktedonobacterales bacterium]
MEKEQVAAILEDTGNLLELTGGNPFEVRAYQNGARAVSQLEGDLDALAREGKLAGVPGIGKTLAARIMELLDTGHMELHDKLLSDVPAGLREMLRIPGLGPKRVRQIHQALNIDTIADLRAACESGQIATLPGFGAKSQEKILKGIAFITDHADRYRFDVAQDEAETVAAALRALPQVVRLQVAGSIRRRKEIVHDIDIVASVRADEDRAPIMDTLVGLPNVESVTGKGETKTSVVLRSGIALDLRVVSDDEYPYTLHHFTGSKEHNVALRGMAHARGIKINEYGIFNGDTLIPCHDEADIYAALGMAYIEPELREERGEIEAAQRGELPQLVTWDDIQGILHVHSTWSDGGATIREMAEATLALGKHYLGMCDHSQAAAYAGGMSREAVKRQQAEIDRLNEEYAGRLRILKGVECDILKDGTLDYDEETLASFDFVVASIHGNFNLSPEEQTRRLIRAVENPYCSILGHPTGRLLLGRPGYMPDLEAVIDRAAAVGTDIELNGDPHRFDLDWRLIRYATDRGVMIPITPDAHSPAGLQNVRYGLDVGRKGWLAAGQVLNALPLDLLLRHFAEQRARKGAMTKTTS